jgi:hypothetical protein
MHSIRLTAMGRGKLAELLDGQAPGRVKTAMREDGATLQVVGYFHQAGGGYIGVRLKRPRRRPMYIRLHETRRGISRSVIVIPSVLPFDWLGYEPQYVGSVSQAGLPETAADGAEPKTSGDFLWPRSIHLTRRTW